MMFFSESDLLPLSGLQHLVYCERQWALIHLEQQWAENRLTAEGRTLHDRVHEQREVWREGVRVCRGLPIRSLRLGITGKMDVVEFHSHPDGSTDVIPVEYKHGRPKPDQCDEVQLCAQALCIEEMLGSRIFRGHIFYGQPRRRTEVQFDSALRAETERLAARMHELYAAGVTPAANYDRKCNRCSLLNLCLPSCAGEGRGARRYLRNAIRKNIEESA